jgi:reverse gyrase
MHMPDPDDDSVRRVVVTESMIDAMSYYQVNGRAGDLYVSFAGSMSDAQAEQLRDIVLKAPAVVVATDNDQQGHKYAALLQQWRPDATIDIPSSEDWNEELRKRALKREQGPSRSWSSGPSLG